MRTRMYGGVRGRKTKVGGKPTFVFLLLDWDLRNKHKTKSDVCLFMHIFAYAEFGLSIKMIKFAGFLVKISAI